MLEIVYWILVKTVASHVRCLYLALLPYRHHLFPYRWQRPFGPLLRLFIFLARELNGIGAIEVETFLGLHYQT